MKQLSLLLLILLSTFAYAQLDYTYDALTRTQTWSYNGNPEVVHQWRDTGRAQDHHVVKYWWTGVRSEEYSLRFGMKYDTLWNWDEHGMLAHVEIYSDSGYLSIDYHDSSTQILQRGEYRLLGMTQPPIEINDSANNMTYYTERCEYGCYVPTGTWNTFHANGQLASTGKYLPANFTGEQKFIDTSNGEGCYPPGTILLSYMYSNTLLPDGTWMFFDDTGKKIREEYYEGGLLRSVVEIH